MSAGVGQLAQGTALAGEGFAATLGRAAIGNAVSQGIGVATGAQRSFSWKAVAASAAGAGVGQAVSGAMGDVFGRGTFGARFATSLLAGTAAAAARGGKVAVQQAAVDAFANALGQGLVDTLPASLGGIGNTEVHAFVAAVNASVHRASIATQACNWPMRRRVALRADLMAFCA